MDNKHSANLHYLWWLALATIAGLLIYLLSPILTPFLLAGIIAYIFNPLVTKIELWKINRSLGAILIMAFLLCILTALIIIITPLFERKISLLIEKMPVYLETIRSGLVPWLEIQLGINLQLDATQLKLVLQQHWQDTSGVLAKLIPSIQSSGVATMEFVLNMLLMPVVLFYLLRDWAHLIKLIDETIPRHWHEQVNELANASDKVLAEFLRGQLSVMLIMSFCYVTGLWMVGLEFALPIGIIAGVLVFVPYLGLGIGLVLATLAALIQFQDWSALLQVWLIFGIAQLLESMVITPWLVGNRIGLHPVIVIFALLAFGQLFGFVGLLLALPASAVLLVWLRHVRKQYLESNLYNP
ncbi:MAG: AI-2E family transporter [Nitrosomonadaceae bacterium]|nr:AI-2E family transporter [Nitrosomonadaceae bacterium]